jgi:mycoredoxin
MSNPSEEIVIYGTSWCYDSRRARTALETRKIAYRWVDIEKDPEGMAFVKQTNHGNRSVPTILFPDGSVLVEPTETEILGKLNLLKKS